MNFAEAFARVVGHEGGFQNHHADRGNWTTGIVGKGELRGTKYGITAMSYPTLDIRNLTIEQAREIYLRDFWQRMQMDELPGVIRFDLFDAAVNSGPGNAVRFAQRAVGVVDDGSIGPVTLAAILRRSPAEFLARFNGARLQFMSETSGWRDNSAGWARRIAANLLAIGRKEV